jgi:DNA-binding MarR family transcriptional regulator
MAAKTRTKPKTHSASKQEATEVLVLLSGILSGLKKHKPGGEAGDDPIREAFEKSELGERHISPLVALVLRGPASVSELADRIGLTPATTSLLVGELSRAGFVQRREDEADRRRTIVSIDESIEQVVRPALDQTLTPLARGLGRMSAAQRAQLKDGLRILGEEFGSSKVNGSR